MSAAFKPGVVSVAYGDGLAVITVDIPPVNTIDAKVREGLFRAVEELAGRKDVKAAILLCEGSTGVACRQTY